MTGTELIREDLQGNILRGYTKNRVRYLMLGVADRVQARRWLGQVAGRTAGDLPRLTTSEDWGRTFRPGFCFNLGLTAPGLRALGLSPAQLAGFSPEFRDGMHTRAAKLGDIGDSAPEKWEAPFDRPGDLHVIVTLHSDEAATIDEVQRRLLGFAGGAAFRLLGTRDGANFDKDKVHFGYTDNISQPRFAEVHEPGRYPDKQPYCPLGTVLLGFDSVYEGVRWAVPKDLGFMGAFNAFRVLEQDVPGFEAFLDRSADYLMTHPMGERLLPMGANDTWRDRPSRHAALREVVAAQMCGRWRNGVPLELSPDTPDPVPAIPKDQWSNFDYGPHARCPYGAHARRCNPRGGPIVQRIANNTRRLVRRGMPYGPAWDPARPDGERRGLLGNFLCANLAAQFEAVMCDWLNLGLQDPNITGTNDPLLGANDAETSHFDLFLKTGEPIRLTGLPRLVQVRGGAYTFIPSLAACRYLASL
ncbi:MAG: hypothetical protein EP307_04335 [Rhodobacteraceae bacterium]|nr:MAG: hypothetical protein EP307_04335 [Paracoccaceae bacterium]